ncbi:hypothetical protein GBA52_027173 [Prunus armeniaca]|nr:hypothetical protein GBA52_027173 [Prunus armeniaca]
MTVFPIMMFLHVQHYFALKNNVVVLVVVVVIQQQDPIVVRPKPARDLNNQILLPARGNSPQERNQLVLVTTDDEDQPKPRRGPGRPKPNILYKPRWRTISIPNGSLNKLWVLKRYRVDSVCIT